MCCRDIEDKPKEKLQKTGEHGRLLYRTLQIWAWRGWLSHREQRGFPAVEVEMGGVSETRRSFAPGVLSLHVKLGA